MPTPGPLELVIILVIALLVLGPGKLPEVGASLGKSLREFRKASTDVQDAVNIDTSPLPATPTPPADPNAVAAPSPAAVAAPVVAAPVVAAPVVAAPVVAAPVAAALVADVAPPALPDIPGGAGLSAAAAPVPTPVAVPAEPPSDTSAS